MRRRDRWRRRLALVLGGLSLPAGAGCASQPSAPTTIVSLSFDDGQSSQYTALSLLRARGMAGTFYVNSAMVGSSGYYMTWDQLKELAAAGNEIGGHTLHHVNVGTLDQGQLETEICQDREDLLAQGFSPVATFAYPEAFVTAAAKLVVRSCGYTSARGAGGLYDPRECPSCTRGETLPPADRYQLRTTSGYTAGVSVADVQARIADAESSGGGWVTLVFHGICDDRCTRDNSMTVANFTALLDWLAARKDRGTVVRTVGEALGGGAMPEAAAAGSR